MESNPFQMVVRFQPRPSIERTFPWVQYAREKPESFPLTFCKRPAVLAQTERLASAEPGPVLMIVL